VTFAVQLFAILGVLCLPLISVAALVLTLAMLDMTLGIRRFYVRVLTFLFDYATKIKKGKEIFIDASFSSPESPTTTIESHVADTSVDSAVELSPTTSIMSEPRKESIGDDSFTEGSAMEQSNQRMSRASSPTDIQFKFSKPRRTIHGCS
jgi:hypothetical protein